MEDMVGAAAAAMAGSAAAATVDLAVMRRLRVIVAAGSVVRTLAFRAAVLSAYRILARADIPELGCVAFV